jgi:hypothetical protein
LQINYSNYFGTSQKVGLAILKAQDGIEQIKPYYTIAKFAFVGLFRQYLPQQRPFGELP